jgi:hypothetical protein
LFMLILHHIKYEHDLQSVHEHEGLPFPPTVENCNARLWSQEFTKLT